MAEELVNQLKTCIERGKSSRDSAYPPDLRGQPGATELVEELLAAGVPAERILNDALIPGMREVGRRFSCNEAFVPDMLVSADAMKKAMTLLRSALVDSNVKPKGTFIIGTVRGDLHDIGKNLVAMMVEGAGYDVVDLGVDVGSEKFMGALESHPEAIVGLSALLTTTMGAMKTIVEALRDRFPGVKVIIGGAPVTDSYAKTIRANGCAPDPQSAIDLIERLLAV